MDRCGPLDLGGRIAVASSAQPEYLVIGRVRRAHGVAGEVAVEVLSNVSGRFDPGSEMVVSLRGRRERSKVVSARSHRDVVLVRFDGCEDRDEAELLRGAVLEIEAHRAPESEPGSYYFHELIGCRSTDRAAGELGVVVDVVEDGGGLILKISDGSRSLLVPFVAQYIRRIEAGQSIEFDLPEGLIETCASSS